MEQARERSYHRALLLSKDKDAGQHPPFNTFNLTSCDLMTRELCQNLNIVTKKKQLN